MSMWDSRYSEEDFAYGDKPNDFLLAMAGHLPAAAKVLMLADGQGRNGVYLATLGHDVHSVDASSVGLERAQALAAAKGVTITTTVADLADYDLGKNRWDGVVSVFCHLPTALRRRVHKAVVESLVPGGVFILEGYAKEQLGRGTGGPPDADLLFSLTELTEDLAGLTLDHAESFERNVVEGKYHTGRAAVVQILGRKPR